MKSLSILFIIALSTTTVTAADQLASLGADKIAAFNTGNSSTIGGDRKVSPLVKLRQHKSQQQFEKIILRKSRKDHSVLVGLNDKDRTAIYGKYLEGERMRSIHSAVYQLAYKTK